MLGFFENLKGLGNVEAAPKESELITQVADAYIDYDSANTKEERKAISDKLLQLLSLVKNDQNKLLFEKKVSELTPSALKDHAELVSRLGVYEGFVLSKLLVSPKTLEARVRAGATVQGLLQLLSELLEGGVRIVPRETAEAYVTFARAIKRAGTDATQIASSFSELLKTLNIPLESTKQWDLTYSQILLVIAGGVPEAMKGQFDDAAKRRFIEIYFLLNFLKGFLLGKVRGKAFDLAFTPELKASAIYGKLKDAITRACVGGGASAAVATPTQGETSNTALFAVLGLGAAAVGAYLLMKDKK